MCNYTEDKVTELLRQYRNKIDLHSTKIRGLQAKLTLKENIKSVFLKARTVPFKLSSLVNQELHTLVQQDILEEYWKSEYCKIGYIHCTRVEKE